jgi:hypothetical protein
MSDLMLISNYHNMMLVCGYSNYQIEQIINTTTIKAS